MGLTPGRLKKIFSSLIYFFNRSKSTAPGRTRSLGASTVSKRWPAVGASEPMGSWSWLAVTSQWCVCLIPPPALSCASLRVTQGRYGLAGSGSWYLQSPDEERRMSLTTLTLITPDFVIQVAIYFSYSCKCLVKGITFPKIKICSRTLAKYRTCSLTHHRAVFYYVGTCVNHVREIQNPRTESLLMKSKFRLEGSWGKITILQ